MKRAGSFILVFHEFKGAPFILSNYALGTSAEHRAGAEKTLKIEYLL